MLRIENLTKTYGKRLALDHLQLTLQPGEIYGLLGPNGAGKTTTINLICNLLRPDRGQIWLGDRPVSDQTRALVGVTLQENLLYRGLTCAENLHFFARIYGLRGMERVRQVHSCLQLVNLADRAHSLVETLSGGMQRRLSIAIALVHRPKLVILDEPTTGLDLETRYEIWNLIRQLRLQGMTVLLTTHFLEEAERLCQRIGILQGGRLLAEGTLPELKHKIPARAIAYLQTPQPEAVRDRAQSLGWVERHYGNELAFWLPTELTLAQLLEPFANLIIEAAAIQPVRLEHIYLEVTRPQEAAGTSV